MVIRSVLGGETHAFAHCFDDAFALEDEVMHILGQRIPIVLLTYSASLLNVTDRSSQTTEKRLMIDLAATKGACDTSDIDEIFDDIL